MIGRPLSLLSARGLVGLQAAVAGHAPGVLVLTSVLPRSRDTGEDARIRSLVDDAKTGDGNAFGALYDRYVDQVYRYVYFRVGSKALAEDLVSETFLRALRRISSFQWQGADFGAWLTTIARNLIADHYKSSRYKLEVPTAELLDRVDATAPDAASVVLDREASSRLIDAVRRLPGDQQECIVLRFLQGMSIAETGAVMHRGDGAIKALQYRATRALAGLLGEAARP